MKSLKWILYNALFAVAYVAMLPSFLLRMKRRGGYRARMSDRFGKYPEEIVRALECSSGNGGKGNSNTQTLERSNTSPIWLHAVSVGEVQVAGQLMREMRRQDPSVRFVFSTTSSTGWKTAEKEVGPRDVLIYNPLDFVGCVRRAFDRIRPRAVIIAETEIWPNFIREAHRRGVPLFLVNARVSDRSAPRYRALRWFFGEVLRCFTKIYAQSELDRERLLAAGASADSVAAVGSFKFDVARRNPAKEKDLREWIGDGAILLGGSTWPGEDAALISIYSKLAAARPDVKLVIAPRHFEKADAVEQNILAAGFRCVRRSRGDVSNTPTPEHSNTSSNSNTPTLEHSNAPKSVWLCDTTGELMGLYGIASVTFVGKSLCAHGSQNMIEPCLCANATLVGPFTENFRPVMSDLLAADALVQVPDADALEREVTRFFSDDSARAALGARASAAVERRRGTTSRCAAELLSSIRACDSSLEHSNTRTLKRSYKYLALALVLCYAVSALFAPGAVKHAWRYLRLDPNRHYAKFVALCGASALYPWTIPEARRQLAGMRALELPGQDEFGVERYAATSRLADALPLLFPGHATRRFDARFRPMCEMKRVHDELVDEWGGYRLWALGRWDYLFVAKRPNGGTNDAVRADALMAEFSAKFEKFAAAGIYAPAQTFACYVGDDRETAGAFAQVGALDPILAALPNRLLFRPAPTGGRAQIRASYLVGETPPDFSWLSRGGMNARIFFDFTEHVDAVQRSRRRALVAFDLADAGGASATNALAEWAAAAEANPCDPVLRNLADTFDVQGRQFLAIGNVNGALRCYENRLLVFPKDYAAVHNFGMCLKQAGHMEKAATVFAEAARRDPANEEHLMEFVTAAAASGHEEDALKVLERLIKKHPENARLKIRAAKIKSFIYNRNAKEFLRQ